MNTLFNTNQIICGDNLEVLKQFPDDCIDLTITSPPYDQLRVYNGFSFDWRKLAKELYRITKQGGIVVWVVNDQSVDGSKTGTSFKQALWFKHVGFNIYDVMIWQKNNMPCNHNKYEQCFEYMFVFSKGSPKTFNPIKVQTKYFGQKRNPKLKKEAASFNEDSKQKRLSNKNTDVQEYKIKSNIWYVPSGFGNASKDDYAFQHPAIFPENLVRDHIISWSNENDIVLDPFNGSGTTCKIAKRYNRKYIGIDISPEYCELARKRIEEDQPLFNGVK
ncbi:MAG: site-specific DNA-methyltransferase [Candidatus Nanoarchaeia archaeon]|nr:site-specific DNA-methyltransferase [Candidatus Nanoarchaeia archaeon]